MASFWPKYIILELKRHRGVIFYDTEEWCKIWRKFDLRFIKWHGEFGKFSPEYSKVSKLELWWDPFIQSRKCMSLKITEELCVLTIKKDAKFEEELTCGFKIDKEFDEFWPEHSKVLKTCTLMASFWPKYIVFELEKYRGVINYDTEEWCKIWRKTDLCFGNWDAEFGKFSPEHWKVSKLELWWDPFIQSRKCMSLKITEELCVLTIKKDAKFEEELACGFKIDMKNLANLHRLINRDFILESKISSIYISRTWKINLRILWIHIVKNFQVKHGHCDSIIFPQNFLLKSLSNY